MKLKNGFLNLVFFGMIASLPAHAVIFPDQNPSAVGQSDDENQDAVSRFGGDETQKQTADTQVLRPLDPISDASFDHDSSRAPASVIETSSRGPASVKTVKLKASDKTLPKKAIVSRAKHEKSYQEVAVIANDSGFYPATVFLTQGIPVRMFITGASAKSQCFMLDQFGVRRQIRSQKIEEVTFVPDEAGTFTFSCPMNGAKGNLVVKELNVDGRVPASVSVSRAHTAAPVSAPLEAKKSEIEDDDFTPEFRNP